MANFSFSKIELFNLCGMKYKFKYLDKLEPDKTYSPLLFGGAIDKALNSILEDFQKGKKISLKRSGKIFQKEMNKWKGKNELVYFKNELPLDQDTEGYSDLDIQWMVWGNLHSIGMMMLKIYIIEILPLFASIEGIQIEHKIPNNDGDNLVLVIDFIAKLKDGRTVLFDNKTSSDIKKNYGPESVKKSRQLALYTDYYPGYHSGYIALQKKLVDGKIKWTMVVDSIDESMTSNVFEDVETKAQMIKNSVFEKNEKSCFSFGRKCEYYLACKYNNYEGLKKRAEK